MALKHGTSKKVVVKLLIYTDFQAARKLLMTISISFLFQQILP